MESLEEVMEKYKLPKKKHDEIGEEIKKINLYDKYPVKNPQAIIDIAPPASGKTGLNSYAKEQFVDNNVVIINSDELKPFHPKIDEIAKLYPQYYTKVTNQESDSWTSDLFDTVLREGYNVIFEGTGRNARILDTIKSKMQNYQVTVRGMAVNELNCLISILERYEWQVKTKGWGRLVTMEHFYETYKEMPNTIDIIEKSGVVNGIEIFKRGDKPSQPVKIYDSSDRQMGRFANAKYAVLGGRMEDEKCASRYFEKNRDIIMELLQEKPITEEESSILSKVMELYNHCRKQLQDQETAR